jgi:hypothetical protein
MINNNITPFTYSNNYYIPFIKTDHELICEIMSQQSYTISKEILIIRNIEIILETIDEFLEENCGVSDEEFEYWINKSSINEITDAMLAEYDQELEDNNKDINKIHAINKERYDDIVDIINQYYLIIMSDLDEQEIKRSINKDLENEWNNTEISLRGNETLTKP